MSGSPPPAPSDPGRDLPDVDPGPAVRSLRALFATASRALTEPAFRPHLVETGTVVSVERGTARVRGLSGTGYEEVLRLGGGATAVALDLGADEIGTVLLDAPGSVEAGSEAHRTERVFSVPAGEALLGRILSPTGRPLDGSGPVPTVTRLPAEREAPPFLHRSPVQRPLQTGFKVVDALIPVGRGQRELILGDRQTGKTTLATETIVNQMDQDTVCVYCAIGQRDAAVNRVAERLRATGALGHTVIVVASGDDGPGLQYVAPFAATSMAEYFVERGRDALIVYDDLSRHARAYRELSLLLRRPPGREAFPGDIFYLHARLLERAAQLSEEAGGGSLTALPVVETEAENLTAYIPTNLISITDGQIYLSPRLFQRGILPAVDVSRSVSRVGAQAQLPAYRWLAGQLRLAYAQFLELEVFSRFATQLDDETRRALERGRRVREVLKQSEDRHMRPAAQIAVLLAVTGGALDDVALDDVEEAEKRVVNRMLGDFPDLARSIEAGERPTPADLELFLHALEPARQEGEAS